MSQVLTDRVAIVTGAGRGIGKACALRFAIEGARLVISDINFENVSRVADEITSSGGVATAIKTDISDENDVNAMVEVALKQYGTIDILLNNASKFGEIVMKTWDSLTVEEWKELLSVNVIGLWLCCKAAVPAMKKK